MPQTIASITATLAPANKPLTLLAYGMTLVMSRPPARFASDAVLVEALRCVAGLLGAAVLLATFGLLHESATLPLVVGAFVCCTSVTPGVQQLARNFRLNEGLVSAIVNTSQWAALLLLPMLALGGAVVGLVPAQSPSLGYGVAHPLQAAALMGAAALLVASASAVLHRKLAGQKPMKMVFRAKALAPGDSALRQPPAAAGSQGASSSGSGSTGVGGSTGLTSDRPTGNSQDGLGSSEMPGTSDRGPSPAALPNVARVALQAPPSHTVFARGRTARSWPVFTHRKFLRRPNGIHGRAMPCRLQSLALR